jgi:hypothetical protein
MPPTGNLLDLLLAAHFARVAPVRPRDSVVDPADAISVFTLTCGETYHVFSADSSVCRCGACRDGTDPGDAIVRDAFAARRDEQAAVLDQLIAVREAARAPFDIDTDPGAEL